MTQEEADRLPFGTYLLEWAEGGTSLAMVNNDHSGRQFHAANWISGPSKDWASVERATLVVLDHDFMHLALAVMARPYDTLSVQTLADWIEEHGGEATPLRVQSARSEDARWGGASLFGMGAPLAANALREPPTHSP